VEPPLRIPHHDTELPKAPPEGARVHPEVLAEHRQRMPPPAPVTTATLSSNLSSFMVIFLRSTDVQAPRGG
jgi:hypothetical protein